MRRLFLWLCGFISFICSCSNGPDTSKSSLPFVGIRHYETRPGVSGTGTPQRQVEIKENGEVLFSFLQINQAEKTETTGQYHAGQFKKIMKCDFTKWGYEVSFFEIKTDTIFETDSMGVRLISEECCGLSDEQPCPCDCKYYSE